MQTFAVRIRKNNSRVKFYCGWIDLPKTPKRGELVSLAGGLVLRVGTFIRQSDCDRFAKDILSANVSTWEGSSLEECLFNNRFMEINFPNKKKREYLNKKFSNVHL